MDYAAGEAPASDDLRSTLSALAAQRHEASIEVIVCEDERLAGELPHGLLDRCPGVRLVPVRATGSYALKNAGALASRAPLVAILDADCCPRPGWAEAILEAFERDPDADAISGRTDYGAQRRPGGSSPC